MRESAYVAALERQNRILRRLTAVCFGLLALGAGLGAHVIAEGLVVHESLIVKDRNGVDRFELVVNPANGLA
ncbi:MAG TPA: hypothetical protein VF170_14980, partial [Planctomycetaceae bacterium]